MDELQLVRDFYADQPPPDPATTEAVRASLSAPGVPARRGRRGGQAWWGIPVLTAAAAAAAVITVLAVSAPAPGGPAPSPAGSAAPVGSAATARAVLLAAAKTVSSVPQPSTARYYVTSGIVGNYLLVGPRDNRYVVVERTRTQLWAARSPHDGSPRFYQGLGARPASAADEAAWRADGSPTVWSYVGQAVGPEAVNGTPQYGTSRPLTTAADSKLTAATAAYGLQQFQIGLKSLTLRQLLALPADPARLQAMLLDGVWNPRWDGPKTGFLIQAIPPVLEMPVTPAVRGALYRLLAGLPGVRSLGSMTDPSGRGGAAVAYTGGSQSHCGNELVPRPNRRPWVPTIATCTVQQVLIIGTGDGMPLASELRYVKLPPSVHWTAPHGLFSYQAYGTPYWTNRDRPSRPR